MHKVVLDFVLQVLPSLFCGLSLILLSIQYFKTRDKEWIYFIAASVFYMLGEIWINHFAGMINMPVDALFYSCFYVCIFLYLRKIKKSLINNPSQKNNSNNNLFVFLIIDFITILLMAFLIFYCFDREAPLTAINYNLNWKTLHSFIYPFLDFLLLGYYTYLSKNFIMNDRRIYSYLSLGFIVWTMGDFIYAFEAVCENSTYEIGGFMLTFGLAIFMCVVFLVKISADSSDYSTIDLFLDSSKFNNLTVIIIGLIYIYFAIYLYCYVNFKENIFYMQVVEECGLGMLFLSGVTYNIKSFYSQKRLNQMEKDASIDPLTGLYTRRYAFNLINSVYKASRHFNIKISALMIDIDYFKKYNDTWGHACGDQILKDMTQLISNSITASNIICRYGGEEILVVLPGAGEIEGMAVAENIRENIEKYSFYNENIQPIGKVTISIGGATVDDDIKDEFELIKKADFALYESKKTRNRCSWISSEYCEEDNTIKS